MANPPLTIEEALSPFFREFGSDHLAELKKVKKELLHEMKVSYKWYKQPSEYDIATQIKKIFKMKEFIHLLNYQGSNIRGVNVRQLLDRRNNNDEYYVTLIFTFYMEKQQSLEDYKKLLKLEQL